MALIVIVIASWRSESAEKKRGTRRLDRFFSQIGEYKIDFQIAEFKKYGFLPDLIA
jgi:hypothetical protein